MRMKMDYNNFIRLIMEVLTKSKSKIVKESAFGIGIGLEILSGYIKEFARIAIERNDEELLSLCRDLCVITESEEKPCD